MSVYEQVKQALQDVVAPELKPIQVKIKRMDNRIDSLKSEIKDFLSLWLFPACGFMTTFEAGIFVPIPAPA